jgi:hypothetical protein
MMRAEAVGLADPVGELGRVVDQHLPLPCETERVHRARDAIGARGAREVDTDAVETRRHDFDERFVEAVFDVETGAFVEAPDRLKNEQFGHVFPFRQRCHIVSGGGVKSNPSPSRRRGDE